MPNHQTAIHELLALVKPQELFRFCQNHPQLPAKLFAGFKPAASALAKPAIRQRLASQLQQEKELLAGFLAMPDAPWAGWALAINAFQETFLLRLWRDLLRTPQAPRIAAAMAASTQHPALAKRGRAMLWRQFPWSGKTANLEHLLPCLEQLTTLLENSAAAPDQSGAQTPAAPPAPAPPSTPAKAQEQEAGALKRLREKYAALESRHAASEKHCDEERKKSRAELVARKAEIQRLQAELTACATNAVAAYRRQLFSDSGNNKITAAEDAGAATGGANLRQRTLDALRRQATVDLKSGTVPGLLAEAAEIRELAAAVEAVLRDSLVVLPELHTLHAGLVQRQEKISALLHPRGHADAAGETGAARRLESLIASAPANDQGAASLHHIEALLHEPGALLLFPENARSTLLRQIRDRRDRNDAVSREILLAAIPAPNQPKSTPANQMAHEIWEVDLLLRRAPSPPVLLIDGYNFIIAGSVGSRIQNPEQLARARQNLQARCAAVQGRFREIIIVYDGESPLACHEKQGGLTLVFAPRQQAEQNADNWIAAWLAEHRTEETPRWLVSDDGGLRQRCAGICQAFVSVREFQRFLAS